MCHDILHFTLICRGIWHLIFLKILDSTDAHDIGTILSHFHWLTDSLTDSLTHSVNNIGLRDASASKKGPDAPSESTLQCGQQKKVVFRCPVVMVTIFWACRARAIDCMTIDWQLSESLGTFSEKKRDYVGNWEILMFSFWGKWRKSASRRGGSHISTT